MQAEMGKSRDSAPPLAGLLHLIDSADRRFWPYPHLEYDTGPDALDEDVRWELMDQVLAVVMRLGAEDLGQVVAALVDLSTCATGPMANRARSFTQALQADALGDVKACLRCSAAFFPPGPQHLPRAFAGLAKRLLNVIG
ncbi:hypothetical protein [Streptomyces yangpuensis]|uniref:hypothetical protein n=1 Tax=Streptomyces yangpuensis TaxID=1648182 RepID=UPI003659A3BD